MVKVDEVKPTTGKQGGITFKGTWGNGGFFIITVLEGANEVPLGYVSFGMGPRDVISNDLVEWNRSLVEIKRQIDMFLNSDLSGQTEVK